MIVKAIHSLFRPHIDGVRVVEWRTTVDETTKKQYDRNETYVIHLYTNRGAIENLPKRTIDITV